MDDRIYARELARLESAPQRNGTRDMTGTPKVVGDSASDKSRSSGNGDFHSGNLY
jgi:hypothetical protein